MDPMRYVKRFKLEQEARNDYRTFLNDYILSIKGLKVTRNSKEVEIAAKKIKGYLDNISICSDRMEKFYRRLVDLVGMRKAEELLRG